MFAKLLNYFRDVRVEMTKVTWPSRNELFDSTKVVVAVSVAFSLYIFAVDRALNVLLGIVLSME